VSEPGGPPILRLGFRPFFLLASIHALVAVGWWSLALRGVVGTPGALDPLKWHAHEMVFGFAAAVLAGFLLTAVRNWTKLETASGLGLLALVGLWVSGRVVGSLPGPIAPFVCALFAPAVAIVIARPLLRARSGRNYGFVLVLLTLGGADLALHLAPSLREAALRAGVHAVAAAIFVFGGRVTPLFTRNALRRSGSEVVVRAHDARDLGAVWIMVAAVVLDVAAGAGLLDPAAAGVALLAAGLAGAARMPGWATGASLRQPILWVLHLGYALLALGYLALGISRLLPTAIAPTMALHVLTIGGLGVMAMGMMSRVALGHTGRPLVVARPIVVAYGLVVVALVARVALPLTGVSPALLDVAAAAWVAAFALYAWVYAPVVFGPRADEGAPS
jgi:uncharacterized protein involved in response to NO